MVVVVVEAAARTTAGTGCLSVSLVTCDVDPACEGSGFSQTPAAVPRPACLVSMVVVRISENDNNVHVPSIRRTTTCLPMRGNSSHHQFIIIIFILLKIMYYSAV